MSSSGISKRLVLPTFVLTELCNEQDPGSSIRQISKVGFSPEIIYSYKPIDHPSIGALHSHNLFPVVVDGNGAIWREASLYILSRINRAISINIRTYWGIADDLAAFKRFLEEEEIDYKRFPRQKLLRPTYRFRAFLQQCIVTEVLSPTTARRRMGHVIAFYRWMLVESLVVAENPPWNEGDVHIRIQDGKGFVTTKKVKATDISFRASINKDPYDGTIDDGGHLRPLTNEEQVCLIDTLLELGNTEMTLIHLIALFTGARIQTILTLRVGHVREQIVRDTNEVRVLVGPGTMVDTKYDKRMVLFIPLWLYAKLEVYSRSERAARRREKAGGDFDSQYLFLSNRGIPFYMSKHDCSMFSVSQPRRHQKIGQTVRQFITDRVVPKIKSTDKPFHYRFHDLRATYGLNLTDQQLRLVSEGKATLHQVRNFVMSRMWHASSATTDLYLNHRRNLQFVAGGQDDYEGHLQALADKAVDFLV